MPQFIIAGNPDCRFYNHATYIANFLSLRLPNFKYTTIVKAKDDWNHWLRQVNIKNKWYHDCSPIIWVELILKGGKPHLIGGLSEFWEYCYDYYGLESILEKSEVQKIVNDHMQYYTHQEQIKKRTVRQKKTICITGDDGKMVGLLLVELLTLDVFKGIELNIKIYNICDWWPNMVDAASELIIGSMLEIDIVENLEVGLKNTDLLIVTGNYLREPGEDFKSWLQRNYDSMTDLASEINFHAERNLHLVLALHGPVCFNATTLMDKVTTIHLHNIVAITADAGLRTLSVVTKLTNEPLNCLGAPAVWGFIGINHLIDIDHIIQLYELFRPNSRAVKNNYGSTLPLGKRQSELRYLCYRTHNLPDIWRVVEQMKLESYQNLNRPTYFAKVRSIISLLKNWYSPIETGNIISLGVISNGTFGITPGIVFSQPVHLENNKWVPLHSFPLPRQDPCGIEDLLLCVNDVLKSFHTVESKIEIFH